MKFLAFHHIKLHERRAKVTKNDGKRLNLNPNSAPCRIAVASPCRAGAEDGMMRFALDHHRLPPLTVAEGERPDAMADADITAAADTSPDNPLLQPGRLAMERAGAFRFGGALSEAALRTVRDGISHLPSDRAGIRLYDAHGLREMLGTAGAIGCIAASLLGDRARPVRAILFDKSAAMNWALGWHQDRTVAVAERIEVEGFGPWTVKDGIPHVAPPLDVLADMVTLRVHLDPVPATNAPLMIAPGSHRLGRIAEAEIEAVVARCGIFTCLAEPGDIWAYATPILHASDAAAEPRNRRVLQVDYAARGLPGGLRWHGV